MTNVTEPCFGPQVNFEEFKEGIVAVLSHSLDVSTSEDESSYLEPGNLNFSPSLSHRWLVHPLFRIMADPPKCFDPTVIPEEVKPKFVKGKKRYGRRSRPDKAESALSQDSEALEPSGMQSSDLSPSGIRKAKLRRSTSLESIEVRHSL